MKRKLLVLCLLSVTVVLLMLALASCDALGDLLPKDDPTEEEYRAVYEAYATYMAEENKEPLTYEAWLESVKGPKGDKGDKGADGLTPFIGANGNWWIGMTDTGIRAAGTDGAKGEKGDKGDRGPRGEDGRGIESMELIGGCLMVFYTDGTYENLGRVTASTPVTTTQQPAPVTTTRQPAPVTTVTTAPPVPTVPTVHPHAADAELVATGTTYRGKPLTNKGYALRGANISAGKIRVAYSFQELDILTLAPVGEASSTAPVDAGTYKITATFSWGVAATDYEKAHYLLPEPLTATWVVAPMEITTVSFGAQDYETLYYDGIELDVATCDELIYGTPIAGLVRNFAVAKVDNAAGDNPVPQVGTVIAAAGYYKVTITYVEEDGKENFENEDTLVHTATVYIRDLSADRYQVKKAEDILIDGYIDDPYFNTATITSAYQTPGYDDPTSGVAIVNPYEYIGMPMKANPGNIAIPEDTSVTLYVLWGEEGGEPYLYVIVDVVDSTYNPRTAKYTNHRDAWVNDSVEFSYKLGGYSLPVLPDGMETYPTYSNVLADAREKTAADHGVGGIRNHTAVAAQKSIYFDDIQSATRRTDDGYTIELKIPARSEAFEGRPGYDDFARTEGEALTAGEFIFLCLQLNDLTGIPDGYASWEEYDAQIDDFCYPKYENDWVMRPQGEWIEFESVASQFMYCSGNRNPAYLRTPGAGPAVFQLSDDWAD